MKANQIEVALTLGEYQLKLNTILATLDSLSISFPWISRSAPMAWAQLSVTQSTAPEDNLMIFCCCVTLKSLK